MDSYDVHVQPQAKRELRSSPGHMRQRIWRAMRDLGRDPRPWNSRALDADKANLELGVGVELRRIRIESWRVLYTVEDAWEHVTIIALRKRPPYDYGDLQELFARIT